MLLEHIGVWVNTAASVVILLSVLKLYEVNHAQLGIAGRVFLASIAVSALYSAFEILAWRRSIPFGMTMFLVLLAWAWGLRAFAPAFMLRLFPPGVGVTGQAAAARAQRDHQEQPRYARRAG